MRKIIAPVNFTENSRNAVYYAADLALDVDADLYLLYVLQMPVATAEFPAGNFVYEEMQTAGVQQLNELWDELIYRTGGKINIYTHIESGSVERVLEHYCTAKKPWMVIMGRSGGRLAGLVGGNNLVTAVRHLPYPIVVVPPNATYRHLFRVLIACDQDDAASGLPVNKEFLQSIQERFHPSFDVLNVCTSDQKTEIGKVFDSEIWQNCVKNFHPDLHFLNARHVEEGIAEYLDQHPADMLMVFPKKHDLFEFHKSHTKKLVQHNTLPVMSIHA